MNNPPRPTRGVNGGGQDRSRECGTAGRRSRHGGPAPARVAPGRARRVRRDRRGGGLRRPAGRTMAGCGGALVSRPDDPQHGHVRPRRAAVHLPQPRHPRVRERRERYRRRGVARCCCARRPSTDGVDVASARRGASVSAVALARGPGNLCSALGITMDDNGIDLFDRRQSGPAGAGRRRILPPRARASGSAGPPTGPGDSGWPAARKSRRTDAVHGRRRPATATDPGVVEPPTYAKIDTWQSTSLMSWNGAG